jgi:hypothetical protein
MLEKYFTIKVRWKNKQKPLLIIPHLCRLDDDPPGFSPTTTITSIIGG